MKKNIFAKKLKVTLIAGLTAMAALAGCGGSKKVELEDAYAFAINGQKYTCPMLFGDFIDDEKNLYYDEVPDDINEDPWQYLDIFDTKTEKKIATAYLYYDDYKSKHTIEDEYMYYIIFEDDDIVDSDTNVQFYGDITFGSTVDEVVEVLGEPNQIVGDDALYIWKELDPGNEHGRNDYAIEFEDGKVTAVKIQHTTDESMFSEKTTGGLSDIIEDIFGESKETSTEETEAPTLETTDVIETTTEEVIPADYVFENGKLTIYTQAGMDGLRQAINKKEINIDDIVEVEFKKHVTKILDYAFLKFNSLKRVIINEGVTHIGNSAFFACESLEEIVFSNTITNIGSSAFSRCIGISHVELPGSIKVINNDAFYRCTNLKSVILQEGVETIGEYAFYGCTNLESITMQEGIAIIDSNAFYECVNLLSIEFPSSLREIGNCAFYCCEKLKEVIIPEGVTKIGEDVFHDCLELTTVYIPGTLQSVPNRTFESCRKLSNVTIAEGVKYLSDDVFAGCGSITALELPSTLRSFGQHTFSGCSGLKSLVVPEGVIGLPYRLFVGCENLTSLTVPASVTYIDGEIFLGLEQEITIYGQKGSEIEKFATKREIKFVAQ